MSSLSPLFALMNLVLFCCFYKVMDFIHVDEISISLLWLTWGALAVTLTTGIFSSTKNLLWWSMSLILASSFFVDGVFQFFILFELSLIPILLIIIFQGNQPERLSAGLSLLIYTSMFSIPFLWVMVSMSQKFWMTMQNNLLASKLFCMVILLPFLVKMPVSGLHFWLPKAHVEASTSGSMILAGLLLKLGSYGVYRLVNMTKLTLVWLSGWLALSVISSCLTAIQSDLKKFIAYSSVTHMTFTLVALLGFSKINSISLILMSLAHGWVSMGLFSSAGSLSQTFTSRLSILSKLSVFHWNTSMIGIFLVTNASIPPFPSFFPETLMLVNLSLLGMGSMLFILMSFLSCLFNSILFMWSFHNKPKMSELPFLGMSQYFTEVILCSLLIISVMFLLYS